MQFKKNISKTLRCAILCFAIFKHLLTKFFPFFVSVSGKDVVSKSLKYIHHQVARFELKNVN